MVKQEKPKSITYEMILDADKKGWTVSEIATYYQMTNRTVQKACQNYNVILKSQRKYGNLIKRHEHTRRKQLTFSCSLNAIQRFEKKLRAVKIIRLQASAE
jgi:hypothetical protein